MELLPDHHLPAAAMAPAHQAMEVAAPPAVAMAVVAVALPAAAVVAAADVTNKKQLK